MAKIDRVNEMTEQNRIRYINKQVRHAMRTGKDIEKAISLLTYDSYDFCWHCPHEDIGYCGLRRSPITDNEKAMKFCFNAFLARNDKK